MVMEEVLGRASWANIEHGCVEVGNKHQLILIAS